MRTVEVDAEKVLQAANRIHPHLQFTNETPNSSGYLAFLDLEVNVDKDRRVSCGWYQKPNDAGTNLNFRSCALPQYKKSVIEGTVHGVLRSTSTWESFDKAKNINRK